MSETPGKHEPIDFAGTRGRGTPGGFVPVRPARRKRRARRIVLVSLASVLPAAVAVLLVGLLAVTTRNDAVAVYAQKFPETVTTGAPK